VLERVCDPGVPGVDSVQHVLHTHLHTLLRIFEHYSTVGSCEDAASSHPTRPLGLSTAVPKWQRLERVPARRIHPSWLARGGPLGRCEHLLASVWMEIMGSIVMRAH
jgi:hypothetical protein